MPVVPRASIDDEVTVPDSETPTGSYPATSPKACALVVGLLYPTLTSFTMLRPMSDW